MHKLLLSRCIPYQLLILAAIILLPPSTQTKHTLIKSKTQTEKTMNTLVYAPNIKKSKIKPTVNSLAYCATTAPPAPPPTPAPTQPTHAAHAAD